ncbi:Glycosyl transferase, family 13 [Corchorus capsularis]|uniref:Alpha-1,3-mannosyl-glycoprotein 2-beta-N-acetylglucosaminyltransferase n=1 Tax=Corchorus capsularis TaxID=210143 RepID=A0A1R3GPD4_COCAP|nr:Glycosyl transferase, family 13 [Corchorus capsularis]
MAKLSCDFRFLLIPAAFVFIYIQMRLFATQSEYADRLAEAVDAEHHCTSQMRLLIDQISMQQEQIVALEEGKRRKEQECAQLKALVQDLEKKGLQRIIDKSQVPVAAVVIMACNRADYLERTVDSVLKYQSSVASKYPLFVSQDGSDPSVRSKALSYNQLTYMQHLDFDPVHTERPGELIAYYKIARHYKWALDELFYKHNFDRVIILEDDMEIAPDFFDYFEAAAALLDKDKSIMAVSSWNDNGQKQFVHDPYALYRSDFFPGLGWMLTRSTWNELSPKWPKAYPFWLSGLEVTGFELPNGDIVKNAKPIPGTDAALKASNIPGDVRIQYTDQSDFEQIARQFGVFEEWKDGVPRTAYKGVVVFRYQPPKRVFLVGPDSLQQLGIENA